MGKKGLVPRGQLKIALLSRALAKTRDMNAGGRDIQREISFYLYEHTRRIVFDGEFLSADHTISLELLAAGLLSGTIVFIHSIVTLTLFVSSCPTWRASQGTATRMASLGTRTPNPLRDVSCLLS